MREIDTAWFEENFEPVEFEGYLTIEVRDPPSYVCAQKLFFSKGVPWCTGDFTIKNFINTKGLHYSNNTTDEGFFQTGLNTMEAYTQRLSKTTHFLPYLKLING